VEAPIWYPSPEFSMDAAIAPCRVLGSQAQDQGTDACGDGGSAGTDVLGGPAVGDELAVPAQDRGRGDQQTEAAACWQQPGEGSDDSSVDPPQPWPWSASLQHGQLVTQEQDLDVLGRVGTSAQHHPAQQLGEHPIDQRQRHRLIMLDYNRRETARSTGVRNVSGTHSYEQLWAEIDDGS
jgi:hypothetical protein